MSYIEETELGHFRLRSHPIQVTLGRSVLYIKRIDPLRNVIVSLYLAEPVSTHPRWAGHKLRRLRCL